VSVPVGFFQDGQCKVRASKGWAGKSQSGADVRPVKGGKLYLDYVIVRIETDEGITGIGESACDIAFFGETVEAVKAAIDRYMGPILIGRDPFDRERLIHEIGHRGWLPCSARE